MSQMGREQIRVAAERAVLAGVLLPDLLVDPRDPLGELRSLADTAGRHHRARTASSSDQAPMPAPSWARARCEELAEHIKARRG
jgi:GTP-binding protein HflX